MSIKAICGLLRTASILSLAVKADVCTRDKFHMGAAVILRPYFW